jgi:hypothetical protein
MDRRKRLLDIREATEFIVNGMMSGCIQMSSAATGAYREIVDQFYFEYGGYMSAEDRQSSRQDFEYFLSLIDRAIAETA